MSDSFTSRPVDEPRDRGTLRQRLGVAAVIGLSRVITPLPPSLVQRVARLIGTAWYLTARDGRDLARANLLRVCTWLAEHDLASSRVRAAVRDPRALERLLVDAYGHRARYYAEVLVATRYDDAFVARHFRLAGGPAVAAELARPGPLILVGLHLGALELPSRYVTALGRHAVAPMEILPNPPLQRYLERSRSASGVELIPPHAARPVLEEALAEGGVVGLIADRDVTGGPGMPVRLFDAEARIPVGPAILAVESHAPTYVGAAVRSGWSDYVGRVIRIEPPAEGTLRERIRAVLDQVAGGFERLIADAPEQWWSLFMPIWNDEPGASGTRRLEPERDPRESVGAAP